MLFDYALPDRLHNPHMLDEVDSLYRPQFHVEIVRELWPERRPAERIAVGDIEIMVGAFRLRRHPRRGFS